MRHLKRGRKLNRTHSHRKAMFRNMVTSLLEEGRIQTTLPKAKELRGICDRMITYGKKGTLHHRRLAARYVRSQQALHLLFTEYAARFEERPGGYTRILKLGWRRGDAAPMAVIELIGTDEELGKKVRATPRKTTSAAAEEAAPVTSKESFEEAEAEAGEAEAAPAAEAAPSEAAEEPAAEVAEAADEPAAEAAAEAAPTEEAPVEEPGDEKSPE